MVVGQSIQPAQRHDNQSSRDDGYEIGPYGNEHQVLADDCDEHNKRYQEQGAKPPPRNFIIRSLQDVELILILFGNLARGLDCRALSELLEALFDLRPAKEQHPNESRRVGGNIEKVTPQLLSANV